MHSNRYTESISIFGRPNLLNSLKEELPSYMAKPADVCLDTNNLNQLEHPQVAFGVKQRQPGTLNEAVTAT